MGYTLSEPAPSKGNPTAKNRVWDFFGEPSKPRPKNRRQTLQPRRKIRPCAYKTASGIPYWPSRDPIEEDGGINLYGFVSNSPIYYTDYLGFFQQSPIIPTSPGPVTLPVPGVAPATAPSPSGGTRPTPGSAPNPAAAATAAIPLVAAGMTDAATQFGLGKLDFLVQTGKVCQELRNSVANEIRNRSSRGGASLYRAQIPQINGILDRAVDESKNGCNNTQKCLWHYTDRNITGSWLWIQSHATSKFYATGKEATDGTGGRGKLCQRCLVCGPKDAWKLIGNTPGGADDWTVEKSNAVYGVNCTTMKWQN
jgi:hypothetical protein